MIVMVGGETGLTRAAPQGGSTQASHDPGFTHRGAQQLGR